MKSEFIGFFVNNVFTSIPKDIEKFVDFNMFAKDERIVPTH